jgi:hypothetical protein
MKLNKIGRNAGANEYEILNEWGEYLGCMYRVYTPWINQFGHKDPAWEWHVFIIDEITEEEDRVDHFESFAQAKKFLSEYLEVK